VLARTARSHFERILRAPVTVTGEVRRVTEWAHIITLVVAGEVSADLLRSSAIGIAENVDEGSVRLDTPFGIPMEVRMATENELGTALVSTTGPEAHLRLLDLSTAAPTEQAAYEASGLNWVAPPARAGRLPPDDLIGVDDMRGDLHLHTDLSPDGRIALDELVDMGYSYAAVTDHTAGLRFGGLDGEALMAQKREIDRVRELYPEFHLLHGAEINVEPDGTLDIEDEFLDELDIVVAGVHSSFDLSEEEQTRRVTSALAHPRVRVLSHPTGRRIGLRPPLRLDMAAVMDIAATHSVALEANGHRDRLDLNADFAKQAFDRGVVLAANSDAHRSAELTNIGNAVASLQAAHLPVDAVVNARGHEEFLTWLRG
jgi:DNA polymerase (family 10)